MARAVTRMLQAVLVAWCALTLTSAAATAQIPSNAAVAPPDQSHDIALRAARVRGPGEQWEDFGGQRIVRNVVAPTLTPVLPDPAHATGAAVIVAPGGGFLFLSADSEGFQVARWLADHGVAAFVLKYRTRPTARDQQEFMRSMGAMMANAARPPSDPHAPIGIDTPPEALEDAQAAVRLVRARASEFHVDPHRVGFVGFSAGAFTTLSVALAPDVSARPDFIAPIYGPLNARPVPADAPPMFLAVALDDPLMAQGHSLDLIQSWRDAHRPLEVHLYGAGGHGFGMRSTRAATALWIDEFYAWMRDRGVLTPTVAAASTGRFNVQTSTLGELLDDPGAHAVLARQLPALVSSTQISMARSMTLKDLQQFDRSLTEAKLASIQAELGQLPAP